MKGLIKLKPSPYYHVAFSTWRLSDYDLLLRLDGELEGRGAVLTHSLHALDSILDHLSDHLIVGPVYGKIQLFVSTKQSKQQ